MDVERNERRYALDPVREPGRWEGLVASVVTAAGPELERRRMGLGLPGALLEWARPALATAATVALLATAAAVMGGLGSSAEAAEMSLAGTVVPESYAAWLVAGYEPTLTELVVALEEVGR